MVAVERGPGWCITTGRGWSSNREGVSMRVEPTRLYRVKDVAGHFGVSVATIYRAIGSGQLSALKLGRSTGTLRVSGAAVAAYEQACERAARDRSGIDEAPVVA